MQNDLTTNEESNGKGLPSGICFSSWELHPKELLGELVCPALPPAPGALCILNGLKNPRFNGKRCIVLGFSMNQRVVVLCHPGEEPITVLPEKLCLEFDPQMPNWYGHVFALGYPMMHEQRSCDCPTLLLRLMHWVYQHARFGLFQSLRSHGQSSVNVTRTPKLLVNVVVEFLYLDTR